MRRGECRSRWWHTDLLMLQRCCQRGWAAYTVNHCLAHAHAHTHTNLKPASAFFFFTRINPFSIFICGWAENVQMRKPGQGIHNEDYGNVGLKVKRKPLLISLCNVVLSKWIRKDKRSTNTNTTASSILLLYAFPPLNAPFCKINQWRLPW